MRFFKYSEKSESSKTLQKSEKSGERAGISSFAAKIACVLIATLIWFYVSGNETTSFDKEFYGVEVEYVGMNLLDEYGLTIISGQSKTVNVTLTGTRRSINNIDSSDISAKLDVSKITSSGEYPMEVNVTPPDGTNVKTTFPGEISLYVDVTSNKTLKVEVDEHNLAISDPNLKIKEYRLSVSNIDIAGPKKDLEKIATAKVDIDFSGEKIANSYTIQNLDIVLVDTDGKEYNNPYVVLSNTETDVQVIVNKYAEVPVKAVYANGFNAKNAGYEENIQPSSVTIKGTPEVVDSIKYVETAEIDFDAEKSKEKYQGAVTLKLPSGIELDFAENDSVKVSLERTNGSKSVTVSNIVTVNCPNGFTAKIKETEITLNFVGNYNDIEKLNEQNICLIADLSACKKDGVYENIKLKVTDLGLGLFESGRVEVEGELSCTAIISKSEDKFTNVKGNLTESMLYTSEAKKSSKLRNPVEILVYMLEHGYISENR